MGLSIGGLSEKNTRFTIGVSFLPVNENSIFDSLVYALVPEMCAAL